MQLVLQGEYFQNVVTVILGYWDSTGRTISQRKLESSEFVVDPILTQTITISNLTFPENTHWIDIIMYDSLGKVIRRQKRNPSSYTEWIEEFADDGTLEDGWLEDFESWDWIV